MSRQRQNVIGRNAKNEVDNVIHLACRIFDSSFISNTLIIKLTFSDSSFCLQTSTTTHTIKDG